MFPSCVKYLINRIQYWDSLTAQYIQKDFKQSIYKYLQTNVRRFRLRYTTADIEGHLIFNRCHLLFTKLL